jgi:hypothetical protein
MTNRQVGGYESIAKIRLDFARRTARYEMIEVNNNDMDDRPSKSQV